MFIFSVNSVWYYKYDDDDGDDDDDDMKKIIIIIILCLSKMFRHASAFLCTPKPHCHSNIIIII